MEITVKSEEEQRLLKRKDYVARAFYKGATPSRDKILIALTTKLKAKKELTVIRRIGPEFGSPSSIVELSVYADEKALAQFEPEYMVKRHEAKAAEKKEEAPKPAEKAPEEKAPAEEKKGDAPAEKPAAEAKPAEKESEKTPEKSKEAPAEKSEKTPEGKKEETPTESKKPDSETPKSTENKEAPKEKAPEKKEGGD